MGIFIKSTPNFFLFIDSSSQNFYTFFWFCSIVYTTEANANDVIPTDFNDLLNIFLSLYLKRFFIFNNL
jgi:hypothetical protein